MKMIRFVVLVILTFTAIACSACESATAPVVSVTPCSATINTMKLSIDENPTVTQIEYQSMRSIHTTQLVWPKHALQLIATWNDASNVCTHMVTTLGQEM